jgi:hypothetical protein
LAVHFQSGTTGGKLLPIAITILALADGILHFTLIFLFFRGNPFQNQTSILFLLNLVGYVVLAAAFAFWPRSMADRHWLPDAALILLAGATLVMWLMRIGPNGPPNPMGFVGYLSKAIEVVLILALAGHLVGSRSAQPLQQQRA